MLVDYEVTDGKVTNFDCVLSDWGAGCADMIMFNGGTPGYAGPNSFRGTYEKDLFSFGRLAVELFLKSEGLDQITQGT